MLEASFLAAQHLFTPGPILAMLVMLPIALFSGATPGGNLPIAAIVLGFAGYFDPWITVTAVIFYLAANDITEPVPSILLGIPGSRSAQATVLDGYPMAQKGLAGIALGASYMCTLGRRDHRRPGSAPGPSPFPGVAAALWLLRILFAFAFGPCCRGRGQRRSVRQRDAHGLLRSWDRHDRVFSRRGSGARQLRHRLLVGRFPPRSDRCRPLCDSGSDRSCSGRSAHCARAARHNDSRGLSRYLPGHAGSL